MSEDETAVGAAVMMSEQLRMLEALHQIAMESADAETVRVAMVALTSTEAGLRYLRANPLIL